jgi:hypothetical protein
VSEVIHEHTYDKSCIQHFGVLDNRKTVPLSKAERATATNHTPANLLAAFVSASGADVSCAWRYLSRGCTRIRLPCSIWRFTGRSACLAGLWAVVENRRSARFLVWVFALEGTIDLVNAIILATRYKAAAFMGAAYWIPEFWVPALLVTRYITFVFLIRHCPSGSPFFVPAWADTCRGPVRPESVSENFPFRFPQWLQT